MKYKQDKNKLVKQLKEIVGSKYIITDEWSKETFCKGWRYGEGKALAVAKPGTLLEIWKILKNCCFLVVWGHFDLKFRFLVKNYAG